MSKTVGCVLIVTAWLGAGCAHEPVGPPPLGTIDYIDDEGSVRTLAAHHGKIVVLDLCVASVDPCLFNARAVSEVCDSICGDGVVMISLLFDVLGPAAVTSYRSVLKAKQRVHEAGPRLRSEASALGKVDNVPRLVIFDRDGRIVEDIAGMMIPNKKLSAVIDELL